MLSILMKKVHLAKMRRNSLTAIGRLPPEVLADIFRELVDSHVDPYNRSNALLVTWVCSRWREVALHAPRLWNYIALRPHDVARISEFMNRSKQVPLFMEQPNLVRVLPEDVLDLVVGGIPRARSLACVFNTALLELSETRSLDAPLLRELQVSSKGLDSITMFPTLLQASWPSLQNLTCNVLSIHLIQALTRPSLTHLYISGVSSRQPAIAWVTVLAELPALKELSLCGVIIRRQLPIHAIPPPTRLVTLSRMAKLELMDRNGSGAECADLLNHLVLPTTCRCVICVQEKMTRSEVRFVLSSYAAKMSGRGVIGATSPLHGVAFLNSEEWSSGKGMQIYLYAKHESSGGTDSSQLCKLDYEGEIPHPSFIVDTVLSLFPVNSVQHFAHKFLPLQTTTLLAVESMMPQLRILEISDVRRHDSINDFIIKLLQDPSKFPHLEELTLTDVVWNIRHRSKTKRALREDALMVQLLRLLRIRDEASRRIKMLDISYGFNVEEEDGFAEDKKEICHLVDEFHCIPHEEYANVTGDCSTCYATSDEEDEEDRRGSSVESQFGSTDGAESGDEE